MARSEPDGVEAGILNAASNHQTGERERIEGSGR